MEMNRRKTKHIQRVKKENNHTTSTGSIQKKKKIQNRSSCIKTCNQKNPLIRTRQKIETSCFPIKNNITCRIKL